MLLTSEMAPLNSSLESRSCGGLAGQGMGRSLLSNLGEGRIGISVPDMLSLLLSLPLGSSSPLDLESNEIAGTTTSC